MSVRAAGPCRLAIRLMALLSGDWCRLMALLGLQRALYCEASHQNEESECQGDDGYLEISAAGGHAHHRAGPYAGGGCDALRAALGMQNGACANEADTGDDALHDTGRVLVHLHGDDHDGGRAESNEHVRPQPGRLVS